MRDAEEKLKTMLQETLRKENRHLLRHSAKTFCRRGLYLRILGLGWEEEMRKIP